MNCSLAIAASAVLLLSVHPAAAQLSKEQARRILATPPEMSWDIEPRTGAHRNQQTGMTFRRSIGGFQLRKAQPAALDGTAMFTYDGKHGMITVFFYPRAVAGCGRGENCAARVLNTYTANMRKIHGKSDLRQQSQLQGAGRRNGRAELFRFVASPYFGARPVYSEAGAFEVDQFVFSYRATFIDKAGLNDLATFLRAFGVRRG